MGTTMPSSTIRAICALRVAIFLPVFSSMSRIPTGSSLSPKTSRMASRAETDLDDLPELFANSYLSFDKGFIRPFLERLEGLSNLVGVVAKLSMKLLDGNCLFAPRL